MAFLDFYWLEPLIPVWKVIKSAVPDLFTKRKLNFITIHYIYITGMTLITSGIVYGIGGMAYIDALFFTSGAATQSGLNTIDINLLRTGQQVIFYLLGMMCNPIIIHSSVVFVRLYWFEKRFKDIVRDARLLRKTRSKSRNNTFSKEDVENGQNDFSVRGKAIRLLRNDHNMPDEVEDTKSSGKMVESSDESRKDSDDRNDHIVRGLNPSKSMEDMRIPGQRDNELHISFLENQRRPKNDETLHIPSPREFERGGKVEALHHEPELERQITNTSGTNQNTGPTVQHITINEPNINRLREKTSTYPPSSNGDYDGAQATRIRSRPRRASTTGTFYRSNTGRTLEPMPYLSYEPTVGRNSLFVNLTEEQREELGGIEYRALKTLALVLMGYFFFFHIFGILCLLPWIYRHYSDVPGQFGQGRAWWAIFTAASSFNDLGFTLTANSMGSFQAASFLLLIMTFLIIIGNTGFPCMLRFVIWSLSKIVPTGSGLWEELIFLLDHPRRCFTLLFPRSATWWLFSILVILNGVDLIFFIILDLNDTTVTSLTPWVRVLDGLFQAASTRTAGFAVVNLAELHPAIQVSYLVMMYISVFPIAISMRRTNVYEEASLGVYAPPDEEHDGKDPSYVGAHLRKQLSFDLWYVFLGLFIIAIVEGARLENTNEYAFTIFSVLFEIVSAYGTVGLSLGYPTINASFSAEFKTLSKLVIIAMQIRGRHRGLPYQLDRAVLVPSEKLHEKERLNAERMERSMTRRRSSAGQSAVDGYIGSEKFRPETGLSSGMEQRTTNPRERRSTNKSNVSGAGLAENHQSHVRTGLGTAMSKLTPNPDPIIK